MPNHEALHELKEDLERSVSAALFSTDYSLIQIILDASEAANQACGKQNYLSAQSIINQAFWDIGMYIKRKLNHYVCVDSHFFEYIAKNIQKHLKQQQTTAFTAENLKRCFKLVEMTNESWFKEKASLFSWSHFAEALDKVHNTNELKNYFESSPLISK